MSYAEIARELGCSAQNVRKIEQNALRKLARKPRVRRLLILYMECTVQHSLWDAIQQEGWGADEARE